MKIPPETILDRGWTYREETLGKLQARYSGFGIGIYRRIENELPGIFRNLRFYQSNVLQREDSYAVCELDPPFTIQLDPDCEVIILADQTIHIEIGTWSSDPCQEAIDFMRKHFNIGS